MWRENPAASQEKAALNLHRKDALTFPCVALSAAPPTNAQNTCKDFWKTYIRGRKTLFNLSGPHKEFTFSRQEFLQERLGSRGATGRPGGRMLEVFKEGSCTNQMEHNGPPPRPRTEHIVGPYVWTRMFKKSILKIRKFFFAGRHIVRIFLPLPPPPRCTTGHVIYNLNGMAVMEPCVCVEPGGGVGEGRRKQNTEILWTSVCSHIKRSFFVLGPSGRTR